MDGDADGARREQADHPRQNPRFVVDQNRDDFETCDALLAAWKNRILRDACLKGMAKGLGGTSAKNVPEGLRESLTRMLEQEPDNTQLRVLAARMGNTAVLKDAVESIGNANASPRQQ